MPCNFFTNSTDTGNSLDTTSEDTNTRGMVLSSDGSELYLFVRSPYINQYTLSIPYDISTATLTHQESVATNAEGLYISRDGVYVLYCVGTTMYQNSMSTAWDISTLSSVESSFAIGGDSLIAIAASSDGTRVYASWDDGPNHRIHEWILSIPWDLSSASHNHESTISQRDDIYITPDDKYLLTTSAIKDTQLYELATAGDLSTHSYVDGFDIGSRFGVSISSNTNCFISDDYAYLYYTGQADGLTYQFAVNDAECPVEVTGIMPPISGEIEATKTGSSGYNADVTGIMPAINGDIAGTKVDPDSFIRAVMPSFRSDITATSTKTDATFRFADIGFTTSPSSTPSNEYIPQRLRNPGNYKREIEVGKFGVVKPSFGEVVIDNSDGKYDYLANYGFDGQQYKLYYGPKDGVFPDDFTVVMISIMSGVSMDMQTLRIKLRDNLAFLNKPVIDDVFTGTGDLDGSSAIDQKPKQRIFGEVPYAPLQLIDSQKLIYFVHQEDADDHRTEGFNSQFGTYSQDDSEYLVYDGGVLLTRKSNYSNVNEILNFPPSSGECKFFFSSEGTYVRLGGPPEYELRCKVHSELLSGREGILGLFKFSNLLVEAGALSNYPSELTIDGDIYEPSPNNIGFITTSGGNTLFKDPRLDGLVVQSGDKTWLQLLEDMAKIDQYAIFADRLGVLRCLLVQPIVIQGVERETQFEFTERNITSINRETIIPFYKVNINYGQTFPTSSIATGADTDVRDDLSKSGFAENYNYTDTSILGRHKLARTLNIETPIVGIFPESIRNRAIANLFIYQSYYTITVDKQKLEASMLELELGDIVSLQINRFGLSSGPNLMLTGIRHDYGRRSVTFTLWG